MKGLVAPVLIACLALQAGCASLVTPADMNAPLRMALTDPVEDLTRRADQGEGAAEYALSFLKKYGLRGVERDLAGVETLRARAARGGTMPITQYIPGINGAPGRVSMIYVQMPGIGPGRAELMDMCGLTLLAGLEAEGARLCGSLEAYAALAPAAVGLAPRDGLLDSPFAPNTPIDPAAVESCEATGALWRDAARRFGARDLDGAAAATDRIIALCGEGQPSWHARTMRALIANTQGKPDEALTFLGPVPRPAPAPIGSYASFVAMQAHAAKGDWGAYQTERHRLTQASELALRNEAGTRPVGQPVGGGGAWVKIFDRQRPMADGLRAVRVGLVVSAGERDAPRAFYLTSSADIADPKKQQYFLDEYRCDGRSTLQYFGVRATPPTVEEMRDLIGRRLAGTLAEASGSSFRRGPEACQFPTQVAPGLGDEVEVRVEFIPPP